MIFSRSNKDNSLGPLAEILATTFAITEQEAVACCQQHGDGITVRLPFAAQTLHPQVQQQAAQAGITAPLTFETDIQAKQTQHKRLNRVRNVIAVGSGKGGVGKSATCVNLAFALMQEGARVGILDADIYGPSVPIMLGNPDDHPGSDDGKHLHPLSRHGVVANSIGYLVPPDKASIWRGPMASRALQQLAQDTLWPALDYLLVDLPPGTGDIQLTLAQQIPVTGALIVTTPQDLALADARKGIAMFNKVNIPVLGIVENMSYFQCPSCGDKHAIFSQHGGMSLAEREGVACVGQLPLDISVREHADGGTPLLVSQPDHPVSQAYRDCARQVSRTLALDLGLGDDLGIDLMEKR